MLNEDYLWLEIFLYLPNEDIFKLNQINKYFNELIKNDVFYEDILYRSHPMVFNKLDNYCLKCNIGLLVLNESSKFDIIHCNHYYV